jgi:clan AA aspartic protease
MGLVHTKITLKNSSDVILARNGAIAETGIRAVMVEALVDTGAATIVINEELCQKLGLVIERTSMAMLADGTAKEYQVTEPVRILWEDREMTCPAMLLKGAKETLLGAIPLEGMDLMVSPSEQKVVGAHGDKPILRI